MRYFARVKSLHMELFPISIALRRRVSRQHCGQRSVGLNILFFSGQKFNVTSKTYMFNILIACALFDHSETAHDLWSFFFKFCLHSFWFTGHEYERIWWYGCKIFSVWNVKPATAWLSVLQKAHYEIDVLRWQSVPVFLWKPHVAGNLLGGSISLVLKDTGQSDICAYVDEKTTYSIALIFIRYAS